MPAPCLTFQSGHMEHCISLQGCDMKACPTPGVDGNPGPEDFLAFMTPENLFTTEAETTVRYLLSGRRYVLVRENS